MFPSLLVTFELDENITNLLGSRQVAQYTKCFDDTIHFLFIANVGD